MSDIGFNDNLEVAGRKFHFQTASNVEKGNVRCEIFENGTVLATSTVDFERRKYTKIHTVENRIKSTVEALHQEMMAEIEFIFLIAEKVKKLKHAPSNCKMGIMFLQNNLIDDAIEQFKLAVQNDPDYLNAYNHLGLTYIQMGQYKKAIQVFNRALEKEKKYADIHNNFGVALMYENQFQAAIREFQAALRINSKYTEAHYNLATLYFKSTLFDKSDESLPPPSIRIQRGYEQLQKLKEMDVKLFTLQFQKLIKLFETKEYDELTKQLEENRNKIFPKDALNLIGNSFYLKFMYGGKGLDNDIIKKYEQRLELATKSNHEYADIWNNLGIVHLIQCRNLFLQALDEFKHSLEINPGFEKARRNKKLVENDGKEFLILLRAILK
jgi:tetratricopeptide (TPR) repeat protein